jgi:hypothetical protein
LLAILLALFVEIFLGNAEKRQYQKIDTAMHERLFSSVQESYQFGVSD